MKKLILVFLSLISLQVSNAQSFYKHALIASLGFGGEAYSITETYSIKGIPGITYTYHGGAGSASYPLSLEYGVGRWLGIGLVGKFDNYIIKKDSATNYQPTAAGVEVGALVNFHIIRSQHIDFFLGLNLGGSHFTYTIDSYNDQVYGDGGWGDFHAGLRLYFGRFGLYGLLSFPTMNYNLTSNNASVSYLIATWKAQGAAFNVGIQYRFLNPPADK